jgi:lipoprotein-anchoring transpeptidase ErfK/SrfK
MQLRYSAALMAALLGCAALPQYAAAQGYPMSRSALPAPAPVSVEEIGPGPGYGMEDDEDSDSSLPPPGLPGGRPGMAQPGYPQPYPTTAQPYPTTSQPYPGTQPAPAAYPGQADPNTAPPPVIYQDANRGPAGEPPVGRGDPSVLRPPADVGSTGSIGPAPVPGATAPAVTGSVTAPVVASLPPEDQPEIGAPTQLPPNLRRQLVDFQTKEPAGTLIVDTPHTYLYLTLGNGKALRYGIGVGREGFTWTGTERVARMAEWPDWHPPDEMIERQPYLPRIMAGGPGNPLGARALYLGNTLYRIHGTNQPSTIGTFVSSGCIRLINEDVEDLYRRVKVGTRVVVLPGAKPNTSASALPPAVH